MHPSAERWHRRRQRHRARARMKAAILWIAAVLCAGGVAYFMAAKKAEPQMKAPWDPM